MKKILITGVAGFIGSNLAERLLKESKYQVIGIDNLSYGVKEQIPDGVEFHRLDIRSKNIYPIFENIDYVFHLAAKNCISDCQKDPVETTDINITGTINVFEASRLANVKKIIYAESAAVYEGCTKLPSSEKESAPESFYAISKESTALLANAYKRYFNVDSTALRYFCVYGPRQDYRRTIPPLFSAFIINLLQGKTPTIYGTGEKRRDFVHVDDINDFHIQCMEDKTTNNQVFNLGSGKSYSVNEMYSMISQILHSNLKPIYKNDLPGEALETLADASKAKNIGWKQKIDIITGIHSMIDYIKNEMIKGNIKSNNESINTCSRQGFAPKECNK
jgi:nucleoside-diphosphate-sugar epimerase